MTFYEVSTISANGIPQADAVANTDRILRIHGAKIDEECLLSLHDTDTLQMEPTAVANYQLALQTLSTWPTAGALMYNLSGALATVAYHQLHPGTLLINCIELTIPAGIMLSGDLGRKVQFHSIAESLHQDFHTDLTVAGVGLELGGFSWRQACESLLVGTVDVPAFADFAKVRDR